MTQWVCTQNAFDSQNRAQHIRGVGSNIKCAPRRIWRIWLMHAVLFSEKKHLVLLQAFVNVVSVLFLCLLKTQIKHEPCEPYKIHDIQPSVLRPDVVWASAVILMMSQEKCKLFFMLVYLIKIIHNKTVTRKMCTDFPVHYRLL